MSYYADLHIHSKHSRATSRDCDLEHLAWWAGRKGIAVVGTGDFTHPAWLAEIREKLVPDGNGLFRLRDDLERERVRTLPGACQSPVRFLLSVEISTIYKKGDRTRKVHHLVYAPDLETVERFNRKLGAIGNLLSDGRPILGLDSRHLLEIVLESGEGAYLIPAHIWTPWFAVLGSMSGFDAIADCYGDLAEHVFAVETGLSSDPPMNWRVSSLDRYRLISSSDAHSPPVLGREAAVFECAPDYFEMRRALETGRGYGGTVEFFPEEGKYHLDGHRKCGVRLEPRETRARDGRCPECEKPLTVGVLSRVEDLADRPEGGRPEATSAFRNLVQLPQIVGEIAGVGAKSKRVAAEVDRLVERLGPELQILAHLPLEDIGRATSSLMREALDRLRQGRVRREAGYDGEYGVIRMFEEHELAAPRAAGTLFEVAPRAMAAAAGTKASPVQEAAPGALLDFARATAPTRDTGSGASGDSPARVGAPPRRLGDESRVLAALDSQQRAAAAEPSGPVLVVAGPGTGKTRTLTHRIAHLVADRGVAPARCLALTFTQRSAEEMRIRLAALLPGRAHEILVTTFHGLGLRILREQRVRIGLHRGFRVADETERVALAAELFDLPERRSRRRLAELARARRSGDPSAAADLARWRTALWERDLVDFDDLIEAPLELLELDEELASTYRERFPFVFVDEYQDVDALQYRLLRRLVPPGGNLFAIGDPDQSIYGFRGSDVGFFLRFEEDYPGAHRFHLDRSYRSAPAIVAGALQAITPATLVHGRALHSAAANAEAPAHISLHAAASDRSEAEFVAHTIEALLGGTSYFSLDSGRVGVADAASASAPIGFADFAVLYRTEAQSRLLAEALGRAGIPCQRRSHERLAAHAGIEAILGRLRPDGAADGAHASLGERLEGAVRSALAEPGSDEASIREAADLLGPIAAPHGSVASLLAAVELGAEIDTWDPRADRVSLLTLHAAKGLEFRVVFLTGLEAGLLPLRFGGSGGPPVEEERRLLFVGMTRARSHLYLTWARRRAIRGTVRESERSPFLDDIEAALLAETRTPPRPARPSRIKAGHQLELL